MHKSLITAAITIAFGLPVASAQAMSEVDYKGQQVLIGTEYRAAQQKCKSLSGNARDICAAEAKGNEKVATAELGARRDNYTAEARHKVRIAKAEAAHDAAKEKCDDPAGNRITTQGAAGDPVFKCASEQTALVETPKVTNAALWAAVNPSV